MTALAIDSVQSATTNSRRETGLLLRSIRGPADSPLIPLGVGRYVIGSAPDADVRLDVHGVEPQHAVLLIGPQRTVLKGFSRFTWVNDGVIRECAVKPGDRVCFGPVEFEIVKPKSRRRRLPASTPVVHHAEPRQTTSAPAFSGWATTQIMPLVAEMRPPAPLPSGPSRRERLIGELSSELLEHLAQLVERETVAADRERRIVEQSAQLEGRRRIAEERQREFERVQAELARAEATWQKNSAEIAQQSAQLRAEREALEIDRQKLAEELARIGAQSQEMEERRASLDVREARLEEQQAALELRASQLGHQEQRHHEVVSQALATSKAYSDDVQRLAEQRSALQRTEEQLQQEREELQREREQYDAERNALISERAHLAMREVEIAELRRRVHEQQAECQAREHQAQGLLDEAQIQKTSAGDSSSELAEREQRIAEAEAALAIQRNELDERKRDIDEQHAAWMLERHTEAARSNNEQRELDQESQAEVRMLRTQISELQSRLREERGLWEMERCELAARAEAAEATPQSHADVEESYSSPVDIAELQAQLEAERTRYEQDRLAWEAEQDLLLRDRLALEAEWRRLEARAEQSYNTFEQAAAAQEEDNSVPPPIPAHFLGDFSQVEERETNEQLWSEEDSQQPVIETDSLQQEYAGDEPAQSDTELHQVSNWDDPEQPQSEYDANQEYSTEASFDDPNTGDEPASFAKASAVGGDVISLRAQLAELFGLQPTPEHEETQEYADPSQEADAGFDSSTGFESPGFDSTGFDETEQAAEGDSFDGEQATAEYSDDADPAPSDFEERDQSDEDIMSAYLARLLKKSPEEENFAPKPMKAPEPVAEAVSEPAEPNHDQEVRPSRRLNAEEKETLRANLDSFRELANQHSRAAVAKHKSNELKSGMQTTSVVAVLVTLVGLILLSAEFWSSQSYRLLGLLCLAVSSGLGIYTLINGVRIGRLKAIERAAAELTEAFGADEKEAEEKPAEAAASAE
jgi:hypothetical protein